jgi:hypothetical protein
MKSYKNKPKYHAFMGEGEEDRAYEIGSSYDLVHAASTDFPYNPAIQMAHSEARARLPAKVIADQHDSIETGGLEDKIPNKI